MEITRNVILDLMPMYLAGEVSADTRDLVEEYLETDPKLAAVARQNAAAPLADEIPVPITQEDKMLAYREAKRAQLIRTAIIAGVVAIISMSALWMVVMAGFVISR